MALSESGLALVSLIAFVLAAEVWVGWRMAKTGQQKMIWWMGVITLIFVGLAVLYNEGVIEFDSLGMGELNFHKMPGGGLARPEAASLGPGSGRSVFVLRMIPRRLEDRNSTHSLHSLTE